LRPGGETDVLQVLAKETGGQFYNNENRLRGPFRRFAEFTPHYYELTFSPPPDTLDGKVHPLRVKVDRDGVRLRHRTTYVASLRPIEEGLPFDNLMETARENLSAATSICLGARVELTEDAGDANLRVLVWAPGTDIQLNPQAEGGYRGEVEVSLLQKDSEGKEVDKKNLTFRLAMDEEHYQQMKQEGFAFARDVTRHPSAYRLLVVVGQYDTRKVGSVLLPVRK